MVNRRVNWGVKINWQQQTSSTKHGGSFSAAYHPTSGNSPAIRSPLRCYLCANRLFNRSFLLQFLHFCRKSVRILSSSSTFTCAGPSSAGNVRSIKLTVAPSSKVIIHAFPSRS